MKLVKALTPYTCALACLESFFSDVGHQLDQCGMLKNHPQFLTNSDPNKVHEYGATNDSQIVALCRHIGFKADWFKDFRQVEVESAFTDALQKKAGVLILSFWKNQWNHCVRLSQIKVPGAYEVMCPALQQATLEDVTFADLVSWGFRFIIVSK